MTTVEAAACVVVIVSKLGYLPDPGTTIDVPRSALKGYTKSELRKAARCLHSQHVEYRLTGPRR